MVDDGWEPIDSGWEPITAAPLAQLSPVQQIADIPNTALEHASRLSQEGLGENLQNFAESTVAQFKAGAMGLGSGLLDIGLNPGHLADLGGVANRAAEVAKKSLADDAKYILQPETAGGKEVQDILALPQKLGAKAGEATLEATDSPLLATAADVLTQNAPFMLAGVKGAGRLRGAPADVGLEALRKAAEPIAEPPALEATATPAAEPVAPEKPHYTGEQVAAGEHLPSVGQRFAEKLQDHEAASQEYAVIPESKGGTVISTDIARELSPDYLNDRSLSAEVHEPASAFTKKIYADKLAQETPVGKEDSVMFTAGGTGAGKTTGLDAAVGEGYNPEIVYDTNMNKLDSAKAKIDQALEAGRNADILYTYRDPVDAFVNGALKRAMSQEAKFGSGRNVPLDEHISTHVGSSEVMRQLAEQYKDDPRVNIAVFDNSHGPGNGRFTTLDSIPKVEETGLREKLTNALDQAYQDGKISEPVYRAFRKSGVDEAVHEPVQPRDAPVAERPASQVDGPDLSENGSAAARQISGDATTDRGAQESRPPSGEGGGRNVGVAESGTEVRNTAVNAETVDPLPEVSARNAAIDEARTRMGLEPMAPAEKKGWEATRAEAATLVKNDPNAAQKIIDDHKATERPLTDAEQVVLAEHAGGIEKKWAAADEAVNAARKSGDGIAEMRAEADRHYYETKAHEVHGALNRGGGTAVARSLGIRNAILGDRYTIGRNMERAEASYGNLTDRLRNEAREHSQAINKAKQELEELQAKQEQAHQQRKPREKLTDEEREHATVKRQVADKLKKIQELQSRVEKRLKACPL